MKEKISQKIINLTIAWHIYVDTGTSTKLSQRYMHIKEKETRRQTDLIILSDHSRSLACRSTAVGDPEYCKQHFDFKNTSLRFSATEHHVPNAAEKIEFLWLWMTKKSSSLLHRLFNREMGNHEVLLGKIREVKLREGVKLNSDGALNVWHFFARVKFCAGSTCARRSKSSESDTSTHSRRTLRLAMACLSVTCGNSGVC